MINREILYERNLTGSYMKIPRSNKPGFDEKIMLKRKLPGLLPVEKCFVNGGAQYWYNISGKQSLDMYCRMKDVGIDFIERMVVSICNEIEILEWNLIDINCLVLDPELVFVSNQDKELIFTIYPSESGQLTREFQQLMEYMLTKVNHQDAQAVKAAYSLYEQSLDESLSIMDIKNTVLQKKEGVREEKNIHTEPVKETLETEKNVDKCITLCKSKYKVPKKLKINKIIRKFKDLFTKKQSPKQDYWVEPEEQTEYTNYSQNPTVCLTEYHRNENGRLIYSGKDDFEDISLESDITKIGQGQEMDAQINRSTISHYHAKIEKSSDQYYIEDLNSTNGTMVNGEALSYKERRVLKKNDIIEFADVKYRFSAN